MNTSSQLPCYPPLTPKWAIWSRHPTPYPLPPLRRPFSLFYASSHCPPLQVLKVTVSLSQQRPCPNSASFLLWSARPLNHLLFPSSSPLITLPFTIPSLCPHRQPPHTLSQSASHGPPCPLFVQGRSSSDSVSNTEFQGKQFNRRGGIWEIISILPQLEGEKSMYQ